MTDGGDQGRKTEIASTSTPKSAKGMVPSTNLPTTIPRELLEQMLKALRSDVDVLQTLSYLAQSDQPRTSAAAPTTVTPPAQTMPSATEGTTEDRGRTAIEGATEVVVEEEPPQQAIRSEEETVEIRDRVTTGEARSLIKVSEADKSQAEKEEGHPGGGCSLANRRLPRAHSITPASTITSNRNTIHRRDSASTGRASSPGRAPDYRT